MYFVTGVVGLRERKKLEVRDRLCEEARKLFAAQDTAAECQAINDAFALGGAVSMSSYTYACSEDQGAVHAVPGGLVGPLLCSTYGPCPTNHRTMMDQLGIACNMSSRRSVCPCQ